MKYDFDYLIVGSGFGGSVSALRLAEKGYSVGVMEMGCRWETDTLPKTSWNIRRWMWKPWVGLRGFFNIRLFRHVMVLHGNAVGGGSITYANTLLVPKDSVWRDGSWSGLEDWESVMPGHFNTAKRMLGVTENRIMGPADILLKEAAEECGRGDSFYRTQVGVFFGDEGEVQGKRYPDPYFDGQGPERNSCIGCGGCMVGCRYNAKNSLDKNYLYLAERRGAQVFEETRVINIKPLNGGEGEQGYEVTTQSSRLFGGLLRKRRWRVRGVVVSASSLGTQELLFKLRDKGSLPNISDQLGRRVRTNAESLIGVRLPGDPEMDKGIAIGSGFYLDEHTHIEATRYPRGSDAIGFLLTALARGQPGYRRIFTWLRTLLKLLLTKPLLAAPLLLPFNMARQTLIFLCMQTLEGHIDLRYQRRWYWPFSKTLQSFGPKIPTFIPQANEFAFNMARRIGGLAGSVITEVLFDIPVTAHCMGGAAMGKTAEDGVIDSRGRVFGYQNLYVCDGAMLGANLGVNPSLTITALSEHTMSHIPPKQAA
ncbi:GMC family oxidoreductase [Spongiibacter sp. KMU-158]|uniref:Cholesterol oxidase n=1 Tax=Spongiibacter pelagi TaxID=2760804 RepID=A0A927BYR4_9GAMM|nr:GMC family oxidoreductase [Spongiibacter pelagi]MBD2858030.1 GMC family oxidoreductase [Spongiibacter pelagi]